MSLALSGEALVLTVQDDGVGPPGGALMDYAQAGHYGLLGMHERADLLRADLTLAPAEPSGTRVVLSVPVPALLPAADV